MTLGERLDEILGLLPPDWEEATVVVTVGDRASADRAALLLGSLSPGRSGASFRVRIARTGTGGPSADATARVLDRLDNEGIDARLSVPGSAAYRVSRPPSEAPREGLAQSWDRALAGLPADWSDLYVEIELGSSDDLDRAALLLAPVNPFLEDGPRPALRFRAASRFGYGVAVPMARRALERLDEERIGGSLRLLRMQSHVNPVHTQGLVWRERGRAV